MIATLVAPLAIVDAQLHEISPWLSTAEEPEVRYEVMTEIVLGWMDAVGVDLTLLNPIDPAFSEWAVSHAPDRLRSVLTMLAPDDAVVEAARTDAGVVGVRLILGVSEIDRDGREVGRLQRGEYASVLGVCESESIPVFAFATGHVPHLAAAAEAYPGLTLIVDHFGLRQPPMDELGAEPWQRLDDVIELSRYPNVAVKATGAPGLSRSEFPFADVWPHLHRLIEAFGADRIMWASDIGRFHGRMGWDALPSMRRGQSDYAGKHTYAESLSLFRETSELGDAEKELILGGTARRLLHLDGE
jgi:L-fuconolactonase